MHQKKVTVSGFSKRDCKNAGAVRNIHRKQKGYRSLSDKPFFHLTIVSYKIFNFEQSIVNILRTYFTTGLDKGRS